MICCPECGSKIKIWKEYLVTREQEINPITGKLSKKVIAKKAEEIDSMIGLCCTECLWSVNVVNNDIEDNLSNWWDENEKEIKV